jgi:hypothetical protein
MEETNMKREITITVDYAILRRQRHEFEQRLWDNPSKLLDGLLLLIEEIEYQKPFKEVKDT